MATAPVLGGVTMPHPIQYEEIISYYGASQIMANGSLRLELQSSSAKRSFSFAWHGLTTAQRDTVISGLATTATASVTLTAPTGSSYTVTRSGNADDLPMRVVPTGNGNYRWDIGPLILREV